MAVEKITHCADCGCRADKLYLHGRCHPEAAVQVIFEPHLQTLTVTCAICDKLISAFTVQPVS